MTYATGSEMVPCLLGLLSIVTNEYNVSKPKKQSTNNCYCFSVYMNNDDNKSSWLLCVLRYVANGWSAIRL